MLKRKGRAYWNSYFSSSTHGLKLLRPLSAAGVRSPPSVAKQLRHGRRRH